MRNRSIGGILAGILLILGSGAVSAQTAVQQTQERYVVRALGVKVGEMALGGNENGSTYKVVSEFTTTGLAGAVAGVRFVLNAQGRIRDGRFLPQSYSEDMDTGERESRARLTYRNGVARASGPDVDANRARKVSDEQQRGAADPLTALYRVFRSQPESELCGFTQKIFDGDRLTQFSFGAPQRDGDRVVCRGEFRRLAGYKPEDLAKGPFALTARYDAAGDGRMRLQQLRADTIYGPATVTRK
ncbi:MAG: DUF3108 domain-containing protein [Marinibacterium sp.]|nr:DUF3108 domain-containing protein [Marinibacterium sp.]